MLYLICQRYNFESKSQPQTKEKLNDIKRSFASNIKGTIVNGVTAEWGESNFKNDKLAKAVIGIKKFDVDKQGNDVIPKRFKRYFQNNDKVLAQFVSRKDKEGLNLSRRVWNLTENYMQGLETSLATAIGKGTDAVTLSKRVSKYLHDYPALRADYTAKFGTATDILDCEWRSARLARTEINMAYRNADRERWSQMDFVVGFDVKRSGRGYDCSVCESLAGKYPKDFKFTGWHPSCRCYVIPILKTDDEFWAWDGRSEAPNKSVNEIKDVPKGFKDWIDKNSSRIADAEKKSTLPYFLRDNKYSEYLRSPAKITATTEASVKDYSGSGYIQMNRHLRGIKTSDSAKLENEIKEIDKFISLSPKHEGVTYRGEGATRERFDYYKSLKKGDEYSDKAFMSSSLKESNTKIFTNCSEYQITYSINGKSGVDISHLADMASEHEVLFGRNTTFVIKKIRVKDEQYWGKIFIELEEK